MVIPSFKTLRPLVAALMASVAVALSAANPSFELAEVRNVVAGSNFVLTFRLTDMNANPPAAPRLAGCEFVYGPGVSTMHSTEIVNGRYSSTTRRDFTYTYRALEPGTVEVPAVTVRDGSTSVSSRPASFRILPPDSRSNSSAQATNSGGRHGGAAPGSTSSGSSSSGSAPSGQSQSQQQGAGAPIAADDLMVRVFFSKSNVYEQEPVVATIKLFTRYDISAFLVKVQPAFEGFLSEELPVPREATLEHYNGQNYHCAVLKRLLLYPQRPGTLSVNSGTFDVTIVDYETVNMGFFRTRRPVERQITTSSNAARLTVRPLPTPRPSGFNGAVGSFTLETSLEPSLMRTNEPSVLKYMISGTGNIKYLRETQFDFPPTLESFSPRTEIDARVADGGTDMRGTYTQEITLVPQEVGSLTITPPPLVYFDLAAGVYRTVTADNIDVRVVRGSSDTGAAPVQAAPAVIEDIYHIHPVEPARVAAAQDYVFGKGFYWLAYALAILILGGTVLVYRRHIRRAADVDGRRLAKAGKTAANRLRQARKYLNAHDADHFYGAVASAMWGYLSDKLGIPASQLTMANIAGKLGEYGMDSAAADSVIDVLNRCEMARFTPSGSDQQMEQLFDQATAAINAVEKAAKRTI